MEYISTSALANELDIRSSDLFDKLKAFGWIERKNDKWTLTELGKHKGGQVRSSPKFGDYIVWPENIVLDNGQQQEKPKLLNATALGKYFNVSSQRMNLILSEFGWIEKDIAGWIITKLGKNVGGRQLEHETSGGSYVLWPANILQNKSLAGVFNETPLEKETTKPVISVQQQQTQVPVSTSNNFRDKFEAKHRTKDGHFVRSRAEVIIDDTLYDYGLVHAYEKKVPIEEELYTDFYLPNGKVYIEFWGMESDPQYVERKKIKLEIYKKYDLKLIELDDSDIANLDDHLPRKLLKYGIKVY
ncbi:hypothetical protein [Paraflavitalea sp. CAU 1676]|uniref:hypothetical protein n=1 Tax=Paraflavitalea sp. CAU 1676 TaxID=3032598 RepID=UPI0023DC58F8|nr:hypothetical protein [Paraflavitalea sp. CAU 1676]MDF2188393.1 hypothetical protein [Paraflavitalea sp. CAU 1676]